MLIFDLSAYFIKQNFHFCGPNQNGNFNYLKYNTPLGLLLRTIKMRIVVCSYTETIKTFLLVKVIEQGQKNSSVSVGWSFFAICVC